MKIGIIGRTNVGKSTFFKAITMEEVEIEDRPFTTIEPNRGIAYVRVECPEKEFGTKCQPHNSPCIDGERLVPLEVIDVAGLIQGASSGKGLGNKFLSEAMEADALIQVIDISGKTDAGGNKTSDYDPANDVRMVDSEMRIWLKNVIMRAKAKSGLDLSQEIQKNLSGLGISLERVREAVKAVHADSVSDSSAEAIADYILKTAKPMIVACNKMDASDDADRAVERLRSSFPYEFMPCSAAAELTIKEAERHGFISYRKGKIERVKKLTPEQERAIRIVENIIKAHGSTGVQEILNRLVLSIKKCKVVFTVQDEKNLSDANGRVLPDAYIVDQMATPKDVAELVHSDFAKAYKGAIDCRTGLKVKNDEPVKNGQILKILI